MSYDVPTPRNPIRETTYKWFQTIHGSPYYEGPWFGEVSYGAYSLGIIYPSQKKFCEARCFAFEWGFNAMFAYRPGVQYSLRSSVASTRFQSSLTSVDFYLSEVNYWSGASYRYTSTVSPMVYQDPNLVYFPLSISFAFTKEKRSDFLNFLAKDFTFTITPPTTALSTAVVVGSVVGGVLLIGLIALTWILYRRRKGYGILKRHRQRHRTGSVDYGAKDDRLDSDQIPENPGVFVIPGEPMSKAEDVTSNSPGPVLTPRGLDVSHKTNDTLLNQPGPSGVGNAISQSSGMSTFGNEEAPPDYREPSVFSHDEASTSSQPPRRRTLPAQSQTLAQYAEEHRNFIPEELEEKLRRAGYVPTDDPDALAEDAWERKYGVTPLELIRLRGLHRGTVY